MTNAGWCQANVDEVFVDLCRQLLRKDDEFNLGGDQDDALKVDGFGNPQKRRRRRRFMNPDRERCTIL